MENKLFVGNLAWATAEGDLESLFGEAGKVESVQVMRDKFTGRARGFAFVTMSNDDEAQQAIRRFEGFNFMGRPLKVNVARPLDDSQSSGGRPPSRGGFSKRPGGGGGRSQGGFRRGGGGGHSGGFRRNHDEGDDRY